MATLTREEVLRVLDSTSWPQLAVLGVGSFVAYNVLSSVYNYWVKSRSPLRALPQPKESANWMYGHMEVMLNSESNEVQERWIKELGGTFAIRSLFGTYQLVTTDTRANTHVLFASHIFQRSDAVRRATKRMLGEGILYAEGERHRDQRRLLNPAFGFSHVRLMTQVFIEKGMQLREIWYNKCIEAGGSVQLNALYWLSKATLDAIGKAGFDYEFETLNEGGKMNELAEAFEQLFRSDQTVLEQMRDMMEEHLPLLRAIAPGRRQKMIDHSKKKMDEVGMVIVKEKKAAILAELGGAPANIDKKSVAGNDLISVLLRANLAADLDPSQRLSDEEVLAQIPSFLAAGHETASNATTWAMYALANNPAIQEKLREELQTVPTDTPSLDVLNALPYLDQIVREVLSLHTVVSFVQREAVQDDVIPLGKPAKDANGQTITHIKVQRGDQVMVPIWLINRSKDIWGPDADQFRPERWDSPPAEAAGIPGIAPNLMSFIGGPRSCIGFRFAIAEVKALLFNIVRGFEFKLAVDKDTLWSRSGMLMRLQLRGSNRVELPVVLTPLA
ncbi:cytochrome P450 [Exidia glandulosa HHB12029]|uniref:Cytochrome P450 n=1 Tax=Exidia glandulosa HHB12029 TaxID=1314781 RepID=A0A165K8D5_EXIGL|nr:cytochrome P450 [Exidia glandulosa HHB12029]